MTLHVGLHVPGSTPLNTILPVPYGSILKGGVGSYSSQDQSPFLGF